MNERNKWEKPRAFVSHDTRDKAEIAQPLAIKLLQFMCPVWYDEFSLKVGDSLRGSIEAGLKECPKCIFVLTPNFLANSGWSQDGVELDLTRELVEKQKVILPVWHNVTAKDVYEYSPVLADRVAVDWSWFIGAPYGTRTRVTAVKGRCPGPLDEGRKCSAIKCATMNAPDI